MAARKHTYIIAINELSPHRAGEYTYKYSSTFFEISAVKGSAQVVFRMGSTKLKTAEDVLRSAYGEDALRKLHLYHIIRFGVPPKVDSITVSIDESETLFTRAHPDFPFLITMLGTSELQLPAAWQEEQFLNAVLNTTKSSALNDRRFVCLYAFLAGTGKDYEVDAFTCYWTAMNAQYDHLYSSYQRTADLSFLGTPANKQKRGIFNAKSERTTISMLMRILDCGGIKTAQGFKDQYRDLVYSFRHIPENQLDALYDQLYAHRSDAAYVPAEYLADPRELGCQLIALRSAITKPDPKKPGETKTILGVSTSAYGCILLDFAYRMRCEYLHGSCTLPLFSTKEDSVVPAFRALNLFLERYLVDHIPDMFSPHWMDQEKQDIITAFILSSDFDLLNK